MDRSILLQNFTLEHCPDWICPTCGIGLLRIKTQSFASEISRDSRESSEHDWWETEFTKSVYSCMLQCINEKCKENVVSIGTGGVEHDHYLGIGDDDYIDNGYVAFFTPLYFEPPLNIIKIPKACPDSIRMPLVASFRLFFSSPSATANQVRTAIEVLLDILYAEAELSGYKSNSSNWLEKYNSRSCLFGALKA